MKTEEEIKARVLELKAQGSPSAQSKARELEIILGVQDSPDAEADMLSDILLKEAPNNDLWSQVPEFARDHSIYTFAKNKAEPKKPEKLPGKMTYEEMRKYGEELYEYEKEQRESKKGLLFSWRTVLGDNYRATKAVLKRKKSEEYDSEAFYTKVPDEVASIEKAELISSQTKNGRHRPLLDIDFPAMVIPSTTAGHCHLYIDKELSWDDYKKLLNLLADLEIIEHGYRGASLARGYSALRLPWIKKVKEEEIIEESI